MNKPVMRQMRPQDLPAIEAHCEEQNERDGTNYPVPQIFDDEGKRRDNIPLALVADLNGRVLQGQIWVRSTELMTFGTDPRATAVSTRHIDAAAFLLRQKGYEGMHCFVPQGNVDLIEPIMNFMKFDRKDVELAHFYRSLLQKQE